MNPAASYKKNNKQITLSTVRRITVNLIISTLIYAKKQCGGVAELIDSRAPHDEDQKRCKCPNFWAIVSRSFYKNGRVVRT